MHNKPFYHLFVILFFSFLQVYAQNESKIKFGAISMQDAQMKTYSLDSTADAVVLVDKGDVHFSFDIHGQRGFLIVATYHT